MRFLFLLFFFSFNTSKYFDFFYKNANFTNDKSKFSNNIRLNIDKIPHRNNKIIKKFDLAYFNFKKKPIIHSDKEEIITDSHIIEISDNIQPILNENISSKEKIIQNIKNDVSVDKKVLSFNSIHLAKSEVNLEEGDLPGINIVETINKAIDYNPKIKSQVSTFNSSKENIKQVYSAAFPSIDINLSKGYKKNDSTSSTSTTNEDSSPQDISINLEQQLYTGGKLSAEANKAKNQLLIEKENLRLINYEVILDSALAYLELLENQKLIELNNLKEEKFKNDLKSIEILVNLGKASQSDLIFAQSKLIETAAEKISSLNKLNITKANYKKVVGELTPNTILLEPKITKDNFPQSFDIALESGLKNNPKIKIANFEENIAKLNVKSQFADALPNVSIDAEYKNTDDLTTKGSSSESTQITAKVVIPVFKGGKNLSKIKQAKVIAKKVRYDLEDKKNEVRQDITKSWNDFKTSEILLKSANMSIEARKLMLQGIEKEAEIGLKSYIDVLQSKEELIDAEFNKITAIKNYIVSALQMKADIGDLSLKDLYI